MFNKFYLGLWLAAGLFALGACGKKGDLILPPPPPAPAAAPSHAP